MENHSAEMRRCLETCDVEQIRRLWWHVSPHTPQPQTDLEALASIHLARTQMNTLPFKLRAYSHRWLCDHGLPSNLPDHMKPRAEREYPKVAEGVGVACKASSNLFKPIVPYVRGAMSDAVMEAYADKRTEPAYVKKRMFEARDNVVKKLLGVLNGKDL